MIKIRIPATTANMGPGFDCLGAALSLYNTFIFEETQSGLEFVGCDECYGTEDNLIYTSMKKCFDKLGFQHKGLRITVESEIPISRGLGSSAACILAGVLAANELAGDKLGRHEVLELANEIEGHPDNLSPALYGGMIVSIQKNGNVFCDKVNIAKGIKFVALIPDFTLSTKEARAVLPEKLTYADAIFNISRSALMVTALTNGSFDLLKHACEDRLHQIYRGPLIQGFDTILQKCTALNSLAVFLSGAGPTIMVMIPETDIVFKDMMESFLNELPDKWTIKELDLDTEGTVISYLV